MRVVVGLGNPGDVYASSRHNIGFAVTDELLRRWHRRFGHSRHGLRTAAAPVAGSEVIVVQPQLYMNLSGAALQSLQPSGDGSRLIVIHDDLDLDLGCVRVKQGGGTAGHHGLDSIVEHFDRDFTRVRVGIGRPRRGETVDYVLSKFEDSEREIAAAAVRRAADAVEWILRYGETAAMNVFNARATAPAPQPRA
jgi:peptidyl-tRNA hydrolase, PTH1 family